MVQLPKFPSIPCLQSCPSEQEWNIQIGHWPADDPNLNSATTWRLWYLLVKIEANYCLPSYIHSIERVTNGARKLFEASMKNEGTSNYFILPKSPKYNLRVLLINFCHPNQQALILSEASCLLFPLVIIVVSWALRSCLTRHSGRSEEGMREETPNLFATRSRYKFDPRSLVAFLLPPSILESLDLSKYPLHSLYIHIHIQQAHFSNCPSSPCLQTKLPRLRLPRRMLSSLPPSPSPASSPRKLVVRY